MVITFVANSTKRPVGGVMAVYEFANAMRRLGHEVHLVHRVVIYFGDVRAIDEIRWFSFEEGIRHHFPEHFDARLLPDADFVFYASTEETIPPRCGLPLIFVQGKKMIGVEAQERRMRMSYPKVCVARWLVDFAKRIGIPQHQLVHIPYGLNHGKYRVVAPIERRPMQVSMLYHRHKAKGTKFGLEALTEAHHRVPGFRAVVFGAKPPMHDFPSWVTYLRSPDQQVLVNDVYNQSRVFVLPSLVEGFGFPSVEAMACGCALVTTYNGGSGDYAIDGETALVSQPRDVKTMAEQIESLLLDDDLRLRLARAGNAYSKRFDWDKSARKLESFLHEYGDHPERYQQPAGGAH
jgi:L-malate glycosyltransferase